MDQRLQDYLMELRDRRRRQAEGYTPPTALADADDNSALIALMGQSASKAGTLGGKEAGSNLGQFADRLSKSNRLYQDQLEGADRYAERGLSNEEQAATELYRGALQSDKAAFDTADRNAKIQSQEKMAEAKLAQEAEERRQRLGLDYARLAQDKSQHSSKLSLERELGLARAAKEKAPSEGERVAAYHANRAQGSNDVLTQIEASGYDPASYGAAGRNLKIPLTNAHPLANRDDRAYNQAKGEFIASLLRKESGAAVSPAEFERYETVYFPQPGDDEAIKAQKAVSRKRAIENLRAMAGSAANMGETLPFTYTPAPKRGQAVAAPAFGPKAGEVVDGYRFKGGDPSSRDSWEEE